MYIPLSDDKHRFVRDNSKRALEIQDKIQFKTNSVREKVREFFFPTKIFSNKIFPQILWEKNKNLTPSITSYRLVFRWQHCQLVIGR